MKLLRTATAELIERIDHHSVNLAQRLICESLRRQSGQPAKQVVVVEPCAPRRRDFHAKFARLVKPLFNLPERNMLCPLARDGHCLTPSCCRSHDAARFESERLRETDEWGCLDYLPGQALGTVQGTCGVGSTRIYVQVSPPTIDTAELTAAMSRHSF
jgi:hypothetical protein